MPDHADDDKGQAKPKSISPQRIARNRDGAIALAIVQASGEGFKNEVTAFFDDAAIGAARKKLLFNALKSFAAYTNVATFQELRNEHVTAWIGSISSDNTKRSYIAALRGLCQRFVDSKPQLLELNPVAERIAPSTQIDFSVPRLVAGVDGAAVAIDAYLRKKHPALFQGKDGRRLEGAPKRPIRELGALRHFCAFLEMRHVSSFAAVSEQDIEAYIKQGGGTRPHITHLRQVCDALVEANILPVNPFFYHAQKTATRIERSSNLIQLLDQSGIDGLKAIDAFCTQPHIARYRALYVGALEDFSIYLLEMAKTKTLKDVSADMLVSYRDGILMPRFYKGTAYTYFSFIKQFLNYLEEQKLLVGGNPAAAYMRGRGAEDEGRGGDLLKSFQLARDIVESRRASSDGARQPVAPQRPARTGAQLSLDRDLDYGQRYLLAGLVLFLQKNNVRLLPTKSAVRDNANKGSLVGQTYLTAAESMGFIVRDGQGVERYSPDFINRFDELKAWAKPFMEEHQKMMQARYKDMQAKP